MPIEEAREGVEILPDHVYVLPPNNTLTLVDTSYTLQIARRLNNAAVLLTFSLIRSRIAALAPLASSSLEAVLMEPRACKL